jgi:hypothetical protein
VTSMDLLTIRDVIDFLAALPASLDRDAILQARKEVTQFVLDPYGAANFAAYLAIMYFSVEGMWRLWRTPPAGFPDRDGSAALRNPVSRKWVSAVVLFAGVGLLEGQHPVIIQAGGLLLAIAGICGVFLGRMPEPEEPEAIDGRRLIRQVNDFLTPCALIFVGLHCLWLAVIASDPASRFANAIAAAGMPVLGTMRRRFAGDIKAARLADLLGFVLAAVSSMIAKHQLADFLTSLAILYLGLFLMLSGFLIVGASLATERVPGIVAGTTGTWIGFAVAAVRRTALRVVSPRIMGRAGFVLMIIGFALVITPTAEGAAGVFEALLLPAIWASYVWPYFQAPVFFFTLWVGIGFATYWVRCVFRVTYGGVEAVFGTIAIWFTLYHGEASPKFITIIAGIYVIVRGLDNVEKGLEAKAARYRRGHAIWKAVFFWNWIKRPIAGISNVWRAVADRQATPPAPRSPPQP